MPANNKPMTLTAELVARVERMERDTSPEPGLTRLIDEDYDGIAEGLLRQHSPTTFWLFAYGSLIWKPAFDALEHCRATARGWHRAFTMHLPRWRGTPEQPGLMMVLEPGGSCTGVAYRLPDSDHHEQMVRLLKRESASREGLELVHHHHRVHLEALGEFGLEVARFGFGRGKRGGFVAGQRHLEGHDVGGMRVGPEAAERGQVAELATLLGDDGQVHRAGA